MLFLEIITIQILLVIVILGERSLLEPVCLNKYSILTKAKTGNSHLDLQDLTEMIIMKN